MTPHKTILGLAAATAVLFPATAAQAAGTPQPPGRRAALDRRGRRADRDARRRRDVITGGPGKDTLFGEGDGNYCGIYECKLPFGNDTIDARDGEADQVDCGVGTDTAIVDALDTVANCEKVELRKLTKASLPLTVTVKDAGGSTRTVRVRR